MITEFFIFTIFPNREAELINFFSDIKIKIIIMLSCFILQLPLNLLKNITALRFTTILGIFSMFIVILVFIIQLPEFINYQINIYNGDFNNHIGWFKMKSFGPELNFIKNLGNILVAFNVHPSILSIYENLNNPNEKRMSKVISRSVILDCTVYLLLGIVGYLTQVENTPSIILSRTKIPDSRDIIMGICRILMALLIFVKYPVVYNSVRFSVVNLFFNKHVESIDNKTNFIITFILTGLSVVVGAFYRNIMNITQFLGNFGGIMICYTLPGLLYIKSLSPLPYSNKKIILTILGCGGISIIGYTGAVLSVIDFIKSI